MATAVRPAPHAHHSRLACRIMKYRATISRPMKTVEIPVLRAASPSQPASGCSVSPYWVSRHQFW